MLSIITPVLNGSNFIEENILIIKQLNIPFEHIVVDGGSTDGTLEILNKYPHLVIIKQVGKNGMYEAINQGMSVAKGNYMSYINCDDMIIPSNYEKLYRKIVIQKADFIYSDGYIINTINNKKEYFKAPVFLFNYFMKRGIMPFIQPSCIFSKHIYQDIGKFNEKFKWSGDFDFFRRIAFSKNAKRIYLNLPTVSFLKHSESLTSLNLNKIYNEHIQNEIPLPLFFDRILYFAVRFFKL